MMQRVYDQQIHVTKEYRKALINASNQVISQESTLHLEIHTKDPRGETFVEKSILESRMNTGNFPERKNKVPRESITKVDDLLEQLEARKWELEDLERSAKEVSDQVSRICCVTGILIRRDFMWGYSYIDI